MEWKNYLNTLSHDRDVSHGVRPRASRRQSADPYASFGADASTNTRRSRYAQGGCVQDNPRMARRAQGQRRTRRTLDPNNLTRAQAQYLASMGRDGDTELVHVNKQEEALLKAAGGRGTVNPKTGLREYPRSSENSSDSDFERVEPELIEIRPRNPSLENIYRDREERPRLILESDIREDRMPRRRMNLEEDRMHGPENGYFPDSTLRGGRDIEELYETGNDDEILRKVKIPHYKPIDKVDF